MRVNKIFLILSFLLVAMVFLGSAAAAQENSNMSSVSGADENQTCDFGCDDALGESSKTLTVDAAGENHNEMNDKTIKSAFDLVNDGDTVIISGNSYEHVHRVIDKKLTVKSEVGTSLSHCSNQGAGDSGHQGIFYLTSKASGTVIEGFTFTNDNGMLFDKEGYSILISGACDVVIRNCTFSNGGVGDAVRMENAASVSIENCKIVDAVIGVNVIDSENVAVENSDISDHSIAAVSVSGTSKNIKIISNNITGSGAGTAKSAGINLTSSEHIYILNNYIADNSNGVYVNCNVTKIEIKGNYFNHNKNYEVLNDYRVRNLIDNVKKIGYPDREIIDNNYMVGLEGVSERPVYRNTYDYFGPGKGYFSYDAATDTYSFAGDGKGEYKLNKGPVFLGYVFEINKMVECPVIIYEYNGDNTKPWSMTGNYQLQLSDMTQVKKGIYSVSIVTENGTVAKDLSSVPVTFYLNKATKHILPDEGDIYRTVMMQNGTATAKFLESEFMQSGNVITAVVPANGVNFNSKISRTFTVNDTDIPGTPSNTTLTVSDMKTYPNSNQQFVISLKDADGNPVVGETLTVQLNSKAYSPVTDSEGSAKINVSISKEGTYTAKISYPGDQADYEGCDGEAQITVRKGTAKIISSNVCMIPKMAEYYSVTLKDASGSAVANQKVTFTVNGNKYTKNTNSKGIAKVKLTFSKNKKTYNIKIRFAGSDKYSAVSKTSKITVRYSSKTAKLTAPKVTVTPKTSKTYTVTLKDANGKGISKQKVTLKINGKKYTKKTDSKGKASVKVKFLKEKTYKVLASYAGSKIYKKVSSSGKIIVAKTATKLTAPSLSALPKDTGTYTVSLKANGKALSKQKVTVKVNGKTYTKTTDSKGKASVSVSFSDEKTYSVTASYAGNTYYKASKATGKITVSKMSTEIASFSKTYAKDADRIYQITLKDADGKAISGQKLKYSIGGDDFTKTTDAKGQISVDFSKLDGNSFEIRTSFAGNDQYMPSSNTNLITVSDRTGVIFIDSDLPNSEIQNILDSAPDSSGIEFLGDYYNDISLTVKKPLNITSSERSLLNAKSDSPAILIKSDDVYISNIIARGNSGDSIVISNAKNVVLFNNSISNSLVESKIPGYVNGSVMIPGYGVKITGCEGVKLYDNYIESFESGIFAEHSSDIEIDSNAIRENNYGIKYGYGVSDTKITGNEISKQIGLYIMTVPEGPTGYGIFLNGSAVNVRISNNHIAYNHIGISLDANYSTGIVITQNTITDNVLEGIRFNAGYDLAENAVEPVVTDNAIYRNAVGPSMMILGEMSANPEGIYGPGQWNESLRLKIGPNWYGTNNLVRWDYDSGVVGYGTMCPRISTTAIKFDDLTYNAPGNYSIEFYKGINIAYDLPEFDMYATLNRGTANESEVRFDVTDGIGTFSFDSALFKREGNIIEISVGSLLDSTYRTFKITYKYTVPDSEVPPQ